MSKVHRIHLSGKGVSIACGEGEPILLAALKAGYPLSYECGSGTCGTCYAELNEGTVNDRWPEAPGLTPKRRANGRVLLCQSEPRTDCLITERLLPHDDQRLPVPKTVSARVFAVDPVCRNTARVVIVPDQPIFFLPGQYALIDLPGVHGLRAYSMANLPGDNGNQLEFYVKRAGNGAASARLIEPGIVGSAIILHAPLGRAYLRAELSEDVLLIAGGSGLAPVLSVMRGVAKTEHFSRRRVDLFFGVRTRADLFAVEAIEGIRRKAPSALNVTYALSEQPDTQGSEFETGHLHEVIARRSHDYSAYRVYMAGPPPMIDSVLRLLNSRKVPFSRIHFDRFA
nr:2Fe-2S iron-sulfur cluster binding domain-containing protein [Nitrosomonas nitrosa]